MEFFSSFYLFTPTIERIFFGCWCIFFLYIVYAYIFFHSPRYTQTMNGSCYIHVLSLCVCIHIYTWWNEEKDTIPMVERRFNKDENITYILQESKRSWRMVFGEWVTRDMSSAEVESATREQMWVNLCKLKQQPLQWYSGIPIYYYTKCTAEHQAAPKNPVDENSSDTENS